MGNQFKQPFPTPEEPSKGSSTPAIPEQDTVTTPAAHFPPIPHLLSGRFPLQGQHDQDNSHPNGQLFHGAGSAAPFGAWPKGQVVNQPRGGQQGGRAVNSLWSRPPVIPMDDSSAAFGPQSLSGRGRVGNMGDTSSAWGDQDSLAGKSKKKRRIPIWGRVVIGFLVFFIALGSSGFAYYQIYLTDTVNSITGKQVVRVKGETDPNQGKSSDILSWGRIIVLLLGSDTDEKGVWQGNSYLTQTVLVASIDTATHEVDLLSIPRDYYINIPGHGMDKLDTAFAYGGSINNNMSGVATVYDTLDKDFGIKVNYYGWVGLQGFIKVVNTVDGVDVNVMHPIVDDTYPDDVTANGSGKKGFGHKRVYIGDGPQHLDGAMALEYVRSRHSTNDFDRSARQQQVLSALRLKIDNAGIAPQLPRIAADLKGSLYTDLSTTQLLELGNFARGIDANKIKHLTLSAPKYGRSTTRLVHGQSEDVVEPNCDAIPAAVNTFLHITTAVCNIASNSGGQGPLLTSSSGSSSGALVDTSRLVDISMVADVRQNLSAGLRLTSWNDLFGIRNLLDLMAMAVLDSPQV